jgi:hypothetical protein
LVNQFFTLLGGVYGAALCNAQWPDKEALKLAKKVWAAEICKYNWQQLQGKLQHAMAMKHQAEWRYPDIGQILNGDKQPGASGIAAASYKPASEALAALPAPPQDKSKGQAMLDSLRAELDASSDEERQAAKKRNDDDREMLARLEQKHLPYGKYQRPVSMGDGSVQYVATDIDHPEQDNLMELSR